MRHFLCILFAVLTAGLCRAELYVVKDNLAFDGLVVTGLRWQQSRASGISRDRVYFYRKAAIVGLEVRPSSNVTMRVSFDAGFSQGAQDVYAELRPSDRVRLRAGQFVVPLGFEALTDPADFKFPDYSLVKNRWKPYDQRDVGVMVGYSGPGFEVACMGLNGNGRNDPFQDENDKKDVAGRVLITALDDLGLQFAARSYFGRFGADAYLFWNAALEARYRMIGSEVIAEFQYSLVDTDARESFYVQGAYRVNSFLEPVARFHMELQPQGKYEVGATAGTNLLFFGDHARVMLGFDWWRAETGNQLPAVSELRATSQLQVSF